MDTGSSETRPGSRASSPLDVRGFAPGTILAERYRIVALVGRGGMGEVYRADDLRLGQTVALKFLPATLERDQAARDRLLAEVRSARTVSHPNVCRVYDVGEIRGPGLPPAGPGTPPDQEQSRTFLTMEYIDGEDLASLLRRIGRLPAPKALDIARQLSAGLAAAHDKGVLHRDLKPANVMIDGRGQARITDFGLAVETGQGASPADYAGTIAYMAPERFRGQPVTIQSDLYALGLILYEAYTGRAPFKATTVGEWQRAHCESTPASPASLVTEIEAPVDRAILRCLEKDPAKRPASATHVAAALPGGDPLAAALAAGETPSPELVAASGEEGTLPRAKAWLWLAACLVALVAVPFEFVPFSLAHHVPFDRSPEVLQVRAREILHDLGYRDEPADRAWWIRTDDEYLDRLHRMRPSEVPALLRDGRPGLLLFCYRQSPARLTAMGFRRQVSAIDPPPQAGDAYVELDLGGALVALRAVPSVYGNVEPSSRIDWEALFNAAHLGDPDEFAPVAPIWWPDAAPDVRDAREGIYGGQRVRVEAAARAASPIFFRLLPAWTEAPPRPRSALGAAQQALNAQFLVTGVAFWISLIVLAALARRNVQLGRGDRVAARRLAVAVCAAWTAWMALTAHSILSLLALNDGPGLLAQPLLVGLFAWVAYLGVEPQIRRTWPHLLITSTRLLDGRWRDPLVGRALLAGVLFGLVWSLPLSLLIPRLMDRPGGGPTHFTQGSLVGVPDFIGSAIALPVLALLLTVIFLAVLLVVRLAVGRTDVAWVVFAFVAVGFGYVLLRPIRPAAINPGLLLAIAGGFWLVLVWLLWKLGALAMSIALTINLLAEQIPWTLDMSRWYAWCGWFFGAVVVGLAYWGFRNVLGRQSAFPSEALDG